MLGPVNQAVVGSLVDDNSPAARQPHAQRLLTVGPFGCGRSFCVPLFFYDLGDGLLNDTEVSRDLSLRLALLVALTDDLVLSGCNLHPRVGSASSTRARGTSMPCGETVSGEYQTFRRSVLAKS